MDFLSVDKARCNGCGACAAVCPRGLIGLDKEKSPKAVDDAGEKCIACGHCVVVCPEGALSLDKIRPEDCAELPRGWDLRTEQVEALLKGRRSIRAFKNDPVSREALEKLIEISRYAPSGVNRQPLRWAVLYEQEKVSELAALTIEWMRGLIGQDSPLAQSLRMADLVAARERGKDFICRKAPHLVFTYALKDDMMAGQASTIALTYFDLAAVSMGLGACWAGYAQMALNASEKCRSLAGLNNRCACFGAMLVGYPSLSYYRIPPRNKPRVSFR